MKAFDKLLKRYFKPICLLLTLAGICLYGILSLESHVWADEAYTFALIRHSFAEVWQITAADVHPPLYYFLLKLLSAPFGYNLYVCRFLSALPCLLLLTVGTWQIRKLFGRRTAVLFMALYLLYPYTMLYATEVRMYSLAEMLVFFNALFAYRCWKENKTLHWILFTLFGTAAAYTHYFALVSAAMVYGLLLVLAIFKKRELLKPWLLVSAATILLYLPWLGSFISQLVYKVNNEYWIEPITLSTIVNYVITVFSANGLGTFPLYFGLAYVVALGALLLSKDKEAIAVCLFALAVPLGTVAVGLAASILVRPVFVIRYILPSIPLAVFFFALVLGRLQQEMLFSALLTVALMGGTSNALYCAKNALTQEPDKISAEFVENLPQADAFVVLTGNTMHVAQELSYRDGLTPIYVPDALGPDNPYPNRVSLEDFQPEEHESILLILSAGERVPDVFLSEYEGELLATVDVSGTAQDVWHLQ